MNKIAVLSAIVLTTTLLGTVTISGTVFAAPPLDKDEGASGLAPGENRGKEFPPPSTFAPGETGSPPGQIIGPDNPGETDESAPGQIIGPDSPDEDAPGQIIGPDNPSETPGHEGQESGIIGPD